MHENIRSLIGDTPLLKVSSLSQATGCEIILKCENRNPGGSIKDRAALQMILDAIDSGALKDGMTIIEGTAGNTGIGLAMVGRSLGFDVTVVMPKGQAKEKEQMISLFGAELILVDPCPFKDPKHFYHTARTRAEKEPERYWWANQFENLSNFKAHYQHTGPEILEQTGGDLDFLVSAAGTGGTIGGTSAFLKEKIAKLKTVLIDPGGSGLCHYVKHGEFVAEGNSFTEGIGIMRLTANFEKAVLDEAMSIPDQDIVTVAHHVRDHDGIVVGLSAALNLAACLKLAAKSGGGKRLLTFWCDGGERSMAKLYNSEFLKEKDIDLSRSFADLLAEYRS